MIRPRLLTVAVTALAAATAFGLLAAGPLRAQAAVAVHAQNDRCLACHGLAARNTTVDVNGVARSIYVNAAMYQASLHAELDCTACHIGFQPRKHSISETIGWLETAKLSACGNCHANEFAMYQGSFHGTLVLTKDVNRAPLCADCHDAHDIVNVNSLAFRKSSLALCTRCHRPREATYLDGYHGKAFLLGRTAAAVCIDCHGGHKILPPSDPASTVSKQNLLTTCRRCHPGANANFTGYRIHVDATSPRSSPAVFVFWTAYVVLIAVVFSFAAAHTGLFLYRGIKSGAYRRRQPEEGLDRDGVVANAGKPRTTVEYKRFSAFHRWIHILVFASFTVLVFTGMPLKYKQTGWAQWLMNAIGGVTAAGIYHRIGALVLIFCWTAEMIAMLIVVVKKRSRGLFNQDSILPTKKDWHDIKGMFAWFVGQGRRPQFARFTYWEKFDFLALVVGTVIIAVTGFMMWFPEATTRLLPGISLNIALVIHSNEALLAVGVIFIFVHFFSAHLKPGSWPLDRVIFTGSLPVEQYKEERQLEYAARERAGTLDEVLVVKTVRRRTHVANALWYAIMVVAALAAVAMTAFIVWSIVA